MGRTLSELGGVMSSAEFSLWLKMYEQEPWDDTRLDLGFGIVAATIANYAGKMRKEGAPAAKPTDFMPFVQSDDEVIEEADPMMVFGGMR